MVVVEILFSIAFVSLFARWFRLPEKLSSLLSIGVGICGVSATIGAAPSIEAEKEETGYAIAVILVFGAAALVVYPLIGRLLSMSDKLFGIWAGLAVDNTAEAVATGAIYSKAALAYTTLAKLCRNALMGFVILGFAVYYARRGMARQVTHKGRFLWQKFPKFVLGFLGLSVIFSVLFALFPGRDAHAYLVGRVGAIRNLSEWAFQLTFVGVGLRTRRRALQPCRECCGFTEQSWNTAVDVSLERRVIDVAKSDRNLPKQSRFPGFLRMQDVVDLPGLHGANFDEELADPLRSRARVRQYLDHLPRGPESDRDRRACLPLLVDQALLGPPFHSVYARP